MCHLQFLSNINRRSPSNLYGPCFTENATSTYRLQQKNIFSYQLRQGLKLPNKLYLMFIGDLEVEIQIIFSSQKTLGPVFTMHTEGLSRWMHNGGQYTGLDQLIFQLLQKMAWTPSKYMCTDNDSTNLHNSHNRMYLPDSHMVHH